jgi:hypothetical protein
MSSVTPITADNFDITKLSFSKVRTLDSGAKTAYVNYNGGKFYIQSAWEMTAPYGISAPYSAKDAAPGAPVTGDYSIDLSLDGYDKEGEVADYYNMLQQIDDHMKAEGLKNKVEWLNKPKATADIIEDNYSPLIKPAPVDKVTGLPKPYPPTQKLKLRRDKANNFTMTVFDADNNKLSGDPQKLITRGSKVTVISECGGVWFANGKFGLTMRALQVIVHSTAAGSIAENAFVRPAGRAPQPSHQVEDDDEMESAAAAMMSATKKTPAPANSVAAAPAPTNTDDAFADVDVDGEEVDAPVIPQKKPTLTKKKPTAPKLTK